MTESSVRDDIWIRRLHSPGPGGLAATAPVGAEIGAPRLVCFPHAGGSASFYLPLSTALRDRFDVLAVQYPGRQDRRAEETIDSIPVLADRVYAALRPWLADGPVAFFGHSMGAVVAYEVARRMEREAGISPTALIVSGRRAPARLRTETVHRRDDDGVVAELRRLSGTDGSLLADDDIVRMILPAVRGDYRAIETYAYEPGPPLTCPVTAFIGDDDSQVTVDEALAWADHTSGLFELIMFRGGHFYLTARREETIARIVEVLTLR
jgi:surfactin synthase thioesterase subunit